MNRESYTLYLADDHQIVIDGLSLLLKDEPGFLLIGSATDGMQAYADILTLKPDLVIADLRMPGKDGLQLVRSLRPKVSTRFIILSMHREKRYITDARNYGADGYLHKNASKAELLQAIQAVRQGNAHFPDLSASTNEDGSFLTPRELDVLRLVLAGHTSTEISEQLVLSPYTVDTHRKNILRKTGAKNVAGLLRYAMDHQIDQAI